MSCRFPGKFTKPLWITHYQSVSGLGRVERLWTGLTHRWSTNYPRDTAAATSKEVGVFTRETTAPIGCCFSSAAGQLFSKATVRKTDTAHYLQTTRIYVL